MESVASLEEAIAEKIRALSSDRQKQVLDFIEFLLSKDIDREVKRPRKEFKHPDGTPMSALEAAKEFAGCLDGGPGDLSTNKKYLQGPIAE